MLKLKIREGVDLSEYGFVQSRQDNSNWYRAIYKGDLGITIEVINNELYFYASVDALAPDEDKYFGSEEGGFDYRSYKDDVENMLCQEVQLDAFSEVLAGLLADNIIQVAKKGE